MRAEEHGKRKVGLWCSTGIEAGRKSARFQRPFPNFRSSATDFEMKSVMHIVASPLEIRATRQLDTPPTNVRSGSAATPPQLSAPAIQLMARFLAEPV